MTKFTSGLLVALIIIQILGFGIIIYKFNNGNLGGTTNFNDLSVDSITTGSSTVTGIALFSGSATTECLIGYTSSSLTTAYYLYVNTASTTSAGALQLAATTTKPSVCP